MFSPLKKIFLMDAVKSSQTPPWWSIGVTAFDLTQIG